MKYLAALFFLTFMLAACGGQGYEADAPAAAADKYVLNIAIFEGGYGRAFWLDAVARFEAAHPGVVVNMDIGIDIERIAPQIARGEVPDFLSVEIVGIFEWMRDNRQLLPLNDFFNMSEALDRPGVLLRDIFLPGVLTSPALMPFRDGTLYFAPYHVGPTALVYNRHLFDTMGWAVPTTWEDFFALDALLDDPATFVYIDGQPQRRYLFAYQGVHPGYLETLMWGTIASAGGAEAVQRIENFEPGAWDNPEVRAALAILARLGRYMMPNTTQLDHIQSQAYMMQGRALFIPCGAWMPQEMLNHPREPGFTFGMAPVPALLPGGTRFVPGFSGRHAIARYGANPDLALEFLRFLYTRESIEAFARLAGGLKATTDAAHLAEPYLDPNVANMMYVFTNAEFIEFNWAPVPEAAGVIPRDEAFAHTMTPFMLGILSIDDYIARQEEAARLIRAAR